jgi:UDP-3-O-[3-hydroxymyristoyl] glucosamine N-acyltransferase
MANSWKKYGGIYKSDKYNSIGVGTMVADQVLIRQRVISSSQVEGSLIVGENVSIGLDLSVNQNAFIKKDIYVDRSAYVSDKLYFNKVGDINNNYTAFIGGNSILGRLGIGTNTPKSFFDINLYN